MKKTFVAAITTILLSIAFTGCPAKPEPTPPPVEQKPLVVFLVRHAEKTADEKDPELSDEGKTRADELVSTLRSAGIEHVHSSDYKRTRNTAAPIAKEAGLEVEIYDPSKLDAIAKDLREKGGRHLVVGHSNTTPELTKLLGGDAGAEINEKSEYDRLYMVTIGKDGTVSSALMRYGKPFVEAEKAKAARGE